MKGIKAMVISNKRLSKTQKAVNSLATQRRFILNEKSNFHVREAYKSLRTNMRFFLNEEGCKKICITSGAMSEGKSITILNLAISIAEDNKRVLLIDADMRRPTLARLLNSPASPGLSNVLAGLASEREAVHKSAYANLDVMFAGDIPPNPSELLGSKKMREILENLSDKYDYILVDTPPVNVVTDTCVVANMLHGVLYLVRKDKADRASVIRGVNQLELTGARLLGFVMNGADASVDKRYVSEYK